MKRFWIIIFGLFTTDHFSHKLLLRILYPCYPCMWYQIFSMDCHLYVFRTCNNAFLRQKHRDSPSNIVEVGLLKRFSFCGAVYVKSPMKHTLSFTYINLFIIPVTVNIEVSTSPVVNSLQYRLPSITK